MAKTAAKKSDMVTRVLSDEAKRVLGNVIPFPEIESSAVAKKKRERAYKKRDYEHLVEDRGFKDATDKMKKYLDESYKEIVNIKQEEFATFQAKLKGRKEMLDFLLNLVRNTSKPKAKSMED